MKKRIIVIIASAILVNTFTMTGINIVEAEPSTKSEINEKIKEEKNKINNAEQKISEKEEERKKIEKEAAEVDKQVEEVKSKIKGIENNINDLQRDNDSISKEVEEVKNKIDENYEIIRKIVKIQYEQQAGGYLNLLLEAKDFANFLRRLEVVSSMIKNNNKVIEETKVLEVSLEEKQNKLKEQIVSLEAKKSEVKVEEEKLEALVENKNIEIAKLVEAQQSISEEIRLTEDQIKTLEKKSAEIDKQLEASTGGGVYEGGMMAWPVPGYTTITSYFGGRVDPITGKESFHKAIDIAAPAGAAVVAANDGVVIMSMYEVSYGNVVAIDHGGGIVTLYAHNTERVVSVGDRVTRGQKIATVGSTGYSTGNHSHFEVKKNGQVVDPLLYLK
ncbi:Murein DD-endopeptidase MepM and murein hydrolase activator NlpD, contain LysM domain [Clostridium collagenovorans DSM 3089]|uniref:Murein DD-endopeptidase MepM and murein hydrolase activator NlpD, contain LysM domain n=1 Tax=Clostridium collagenovorans DSM 3089 TaxID=1121306 RepID=A0A1M5XHZ5_9CLOT|nr:peptidoglycan DD-metalloendopeptidase family protein [Clostridium collagenovorans]SHH99431.1 Murein DD-endopeptidase MepM and murein hydrolase activator NlpD, contain LysM domain [Clostridium collagenovorans DSM 3089]